MTATVWVGLMFALGVVVGFIVAVTK